MVFLTNEENSNFIVGSGCSLHMANNKNIFESLEDLKSNVMVAEKNQSMVPQGRGVIKTGTCTLKEVPDLTNNSLYVHAINETEGNVTFTNNKVPIMKYNELIFEGEKQNNGLFVINLTQENTFLSKNEESVMFNWHRKLGHLSETK